MQRQHLSQRVLSLLLAFMMILTCAPTALAEESTEAAMMRLMKTEGTVSVTNAKGRSVKTRDDMRLNSGYGLETEEASYAWINLDDAKLVKMDAVSDISIRKSGKKLDILLNSGNLFFNVSKPLDDDETFTIRTSTMGIGIRGTCGWVKVIDQWTTLVYVLEGTVTVTVTDPVTGETKTETVKGGETVTCKVYPQDTSGSKCDIIRQGFTVEDIDGFVLVELVGDRSLCDKIYADSGLDILGSGIDAAAKLKEDQAAVHEKLEKINGELAELEHNVSKDPVWANPVSDGTPPSEGSCDDSGSSSDTTPTVPTETITLLMPQTAAAVNETLGRADVRQVILQPGTRSRASTATLLDVDSYLSVPSGKVLTLQSGVGIAVPSGNTLAVNGTLTVDGAFTLTGSLAFSGLIRAKSFDLPAGSDWKQSDSADSQGFYTLQRRSSGVTITFDPTGGTVTPTTAVTGSNHRLTSLPTPTRTGYTFDGWYTAPTGGAQVTTGTWFSTDATVYARWTENATATYTITFHGNGSPAMQTLTTNEDGTVDISIISEPLRTGYTFTGWFTETAGGTQITAATVFTKDTTVYAHWMEESTSGVTWRYDEATRTLYIEGSGEIRSYPVETDTTTAPWAIHATEMQSLVIEDGITSIGNNAFFGCSNLTNAAIPSSVTSMGESVFRNCSSLTNVTIPTGVTNIDFATFLGCSALTKVTIPDGVTNIGNHAFDDCSALTNVTIPSSVSSIGFQAFFECTSLSDVYYGGTRAQWNGIDIGSDNAPLLNATIHCTDDSAEEIGGEAGDSAFWSYDQASKTLRIYGSGSTINDSDGTSAPWNAFRSEIENVVVENGITELGFYSFGRFANLSNVTLSDGIVEIGASSFWECPNLTSIILPSSLQLIRQSLFYNCTGLTSIVIPEGATRIDYHAFSGCSNLKTITIPASITEINPNAFNNCSALTAVYYTGTETQWNAITIGSNNTPLTSATIHYNSRARSAVSYSALGYTDVPATASYAEAVRYCKDNNLMTGTSDTTFTPDGTLTRAMMVTVLHRLAGKPFAYATDSFADVEQGKWYSEAISWASGKGIVNGYNATTFGTDDPVTHEQVGLILQRYSGDQSIQVTGGESPKTPATRAEIAQTLMNYAKNRKPGTLSDTSAIDVMCSPSGIALDKDGNLMVTDVYGKQLWRVQNRNGTAYAGGATVLDLYGQPVGGYNDASLQNSFFKEPWAIAPFLDGWAVSDTANNVVRLVGVSSVQTLNGATNEKLKVTNLGVAFDGPTGLASDDDGNLYVSDTLSGAVRRVNPQGGVVTVAKNLSDPTGLCWKDGALYIAETGRNRIVKLEKGKVTTVAGSGVEALTDGSAGEAAFSSPQGVAVGDDGSVYVADTGNGAVRVVKGGTVTTLAVRDPEQLGGGLMNPAGLLVRGNSLYICDTFARRIFVYQLG